MQTDKRCQGSMYVHMKCILRVVFEDGTKVTRVQETNLCGNARKQVYILFEKWSNEKWTNNNNVKKSTLKYQSSVYSPTLDHTSYHRLEN